MVGWSMGSRIYTVLVLDALPMALWRRQPKQSVTVHSDHASLFIGHDWQDFLRDHNLVSSMSRRGSCHDNAVNLVSTMVYQGIPVRRNRVADSAHCSLPSTDLNCQRGALCCCRLTELTCIWYVVGSYRLGQPPRNG